MPKTGGTSNRGFRGEFNLCWRSLAVYFMLPQAFWLPLSSSGRIQLPGPAPLTIPEVRVPNIPVLSPLLRIFNQVLSNSLTFLFHSPLPIGIIPATLVIAYILYRGGRYLRGRLARGTPITPLTPLNFRGPRGSATTGTPNEGNDSQKETPSRIRIYDAHGFVEADEEWKAASISAPPPSSTGLGMRFTIAFLLMVFVILLIHHYLLFGYDNAVNWLGSLFYWPLPWPGNAPGHSLAIAPSLRRAVPDYIFLMYLSVLISFAVSSGLFSRRFAFSPHQRRLGIAVILAYVAVSLVADTVFYTVVNQFYYSAFLVVRALIGGAFFGLLLLVSLKFPPPIYTYPEFPRDRGAIWLLVGTVLFSVALSIATLYLAYRYLGLGRTPLGFRVPYAGLAGSIAPIGVLLLFPLLAFTIWGLLGSAIYSADLRNHPPANLTDYHPSVSILIPAYNEQESLAQTLTAADVAAGIYPGSVEIVIGNDGSLDRTREVALDSIRRLSHANGVVVDLPHGGKSNALNYALRVARGEVIIRCDADCQISSTLGFGAMVRHFADPDIGGVQALILPRQRDGWTRKLRMMEIAWNHLFLRRAQMATLTPQVLDGALCAYRRVDLLHAGGWVPWNGEDSEVTIRLLRIGFRMRFEPDSAGFEDVPADFAALRKQRVRWNRGGLFAHRPHFGALVSEAPEYGGLAILYWFLTFFRGGLRSILYVWAIFATLLLRLPTFEHVVIIAAILLIPRAMVMGYYLAYYHRLTDLHWILFWPVGSAIKQYFALEATGTMLPGSLTEYAE